MTPTPRSLAAHATPARWRGDNRYWLLLGLMVWALVVLMIVPDGFNYASLAANVAAPENGTAGSRFAWLALLGGSTVLILSRLSLAFVLLRWLNPFLLAFVLLAAASILWSIEPGITLRRMIRVLTIVLVCTAFVLAAWHPRRFQNVLRPILTLMLLGSIIFGIVFPALAIHHETSHELLNAWRGLTNHKNGLGALSCFGVILWFHGWLSREVSTRAALMGLAIAVTCLLLSRSSTALMATLFAVALLLLLLRTPASLRPWIPSIVAIFVVLLLTYALAVLQLIPGISVLLGPLSDLIGKDMTMSGRTAIWDILSRHIAERPLFGTGYGAYWIGPVEHSPSYEFARSLGGYYPASAHNGYLDILNDLGWAGLLCLLAYIVVHIRQSLRLLGLDRNQAALFLALFFQQGITNLSETHWFSVLSVDFVIMTLASAALARSLLEHSLRESFGAPVSTAPRVVARRARPLQPVGPPA